VIPKENIGSHSAFFPCSLLEEADCVLADWLITIARKQQRPASRFDLREPFLALFSMPMNVSDFLSFKIMTIASVNGFIS